MSPRLNMYNSSSLKHESELNIENYDEFDVKQDQVDSFQQLHLDIKDKESTGNPIKK